MATATLDEVVRDARAVGQHLPPEVFFTPPSPPRTLEGIFCDGDLEGRVRYLTELTDRVIELYRQSCRVVELNGLSPRDTLAEASEILRETTRDLLYRAEPFLSLIQLARDNHLQVPGWAEEAADSVNQLRRIRQELRGWPRSYLAKLKRVRRGEWVTPRHLNAAPNVLAAGGLCGAGVVFLGLAPFYAGFLVGSLALAVLTAAAFTASP